MNFKQALIAHLQGEKVEAMGIEGEWKPLMNKIGDGNFSYIDHNVYIDLKFRLAPSTIMCNGVEVPAPEKEAPKFGAVYFSPNPSEKHLCCMSSWTGDSFDMHRLTTEQIYLNKDDAIARAKAMLIVQEVK